MAREIKEVFGERCVGIFGVGIAPTPIRRFKRRRRKQVDSGATSDDDGSSPAGEGIVRDILIEAIRRSPAGAASGMYLSTWEGHPDLECSWVRDGGMSKATKEWWMLER